MDLYDQEKKGYDPETNQYEPAMKKACRYIRYALLCATVLYMHLPLIVYMARDVGPTMVLGFSMLVCLGVIGVAMVVSNVFESPPHKGKGWRGPRKPSLDWAADVFNQGFRLGRYCCCWRAGDEPLEARRPRWIFRILHFFHLFSWACVVAWAYLEGYFSMMLGVQAAGFLVIVLCY